MIVHDIVQCCVQVVSKCVRKQYSYVTSNATSHVMFIEYIILYPTFLGSIYHQCSLVPKQKAWAQDEATTM